MSMGCGFTSTYDGFCYNPCFGNFWGLSAGTGKLCIFGHLGLVFIWSCFVSCLLLRNLCSGTHRRNQFLF